MDHHWQPPSEITAKEPQRDDGYSNGTWTITGNHHQRSWPRNHNETTIIPTGHGPSLATTIRDHGQGTTTRRRLFQRDMDHHWQPPSEIMAKEPQRDDDYSNGTWTITGN